MLIVRLADLSTLRKHEANQPRLNVSLGSYNMPPAEEFTIWLVTFGDADLERLYLLSDFRSHTIGAVGKLKGVRPKGTYQEIVQAKLEDDIDLRTAESLAPVLVCAELEGRPISILDGNHRITAHYLKFSGLTDVYAFVCVHPNISSWRHFVTAARP
jgi:hypothetical protein